VERADPGSTRVERADPGSTRVEGADSGSSGKRPLKGSIVGLPVVTSPPPQILNTELRFYVLLGTK